MERYGKFMVYTHEEMLDKHFGPKGTPERDAFDAEIERDVLETLARQAQERADKGLPVDVYDDVEEEMEVEMEMA